VIFFFLSPSGGERRCSPSGDRDWFLYLSPPDVDQRCSFFPPLLLVENDGSAFFFFLLLWARCDVKLSFFPRRGHSFPFPAALRNNGYSSFFITVGERHLFLSRRFRAWRFPFFPSLLLLRRLRKLTTPFFSSSTAASMSRFLPVSPLQSACRLSLLFSVVTTRELFLFFLPCDN